MTTTLLAGNPEDLPEGTTNPGIVKPDAKPPVGTTPTVEEETVNVKLLQDVLNYIKAHPQSWRQTDWYMVLDWQKREIVPHLVEVEYSEVNSCGTAMCFAGHAALMEGFPAPPKTGPWVRDVDGKAWGEGVDEFARKRLGLSYDVAEELFDGDNTIEVLEKMVEEIIENPDVHFYTLVDIRDEVLNQEDEE
jgi:hypothetical protein